MGKLGIALTFVTSAVGAVSSYIHPPPFSPLEKAPATHCIRGWVGPRASLDAMEERKTLFLPRIEARPPSPLSVAILTVKNGYRSRTKLVKDKKYYLLADSHSILNRQKYYLCQLLKVHEVENVTHSEMHTTQTSIRESTSFEFEIWRGVDKIQAEFIQAGG
jgi:hypothetical protein